jgi:hypothetical protein
MQTLVDSPCGDRDDRKAGFEAVRLGGAVVTVAHVSESL